MSELEPLDTVSERWTVEFVGGTRRMVGHQHWRISVNDDHLGPDRQHLTVDLAEHAVQSETIDDKLQLGDAHARVLHVH